MNRTLALTVLCTGLVAVSALAGSGATFMYLAKPVEQWNIDFNETQLVAHASALQALREGKADPALQQLELAAAHAINQLAKAKAARANAQITYASAQAIQYMCSNPPAFAGATTGQPPSINEACTALLDSGANK